MAESVKGKNEGQEKRLMEDNRNSPQSTSLSADIDIKIKELLTRIHRLEAQVTQITVCVKKNHAKVSTQESVISCHYKLIDDRLNQMNKAVNDRLAEVTKRIYGIEIGKIGISSSNRVPPSPTPISLEVTNLPLEGTHHRTSLQNTSTQLQVQSNPFPIVETTEILDLAPPTIPGLAPITEPEPRIQVIQVFPTSATSATGACPTDFDDKVCPKCGDTFTRPSNMLRHVRLVHSGLAKIHLQCGFCDASYCDRPKLRIHQRQVHGMELEGSDANLTACPEDCGHAFTRAQDLLLHLKTCPGRGHIQTRAEPAIPTNEQQDPEDEDEDSDNPFETDESDSNLDHAVVGPAEPNLKLEKGQICINTDASILNPLRCKFCPPSHSLVFGDAQSLANHYTCNHPIPNLADNPPSDPLATAEDQLNSAANDNVNLASNKLQQPKRKYPPSGWCLKCGKYFHNLTKHRWTHKPVLERRKYFCKTCGASFYSITGMQCHQQRKHRGERPFCETNYAERQNFKASQRKPETSFQNRWQCKLCPLTPRLVFEDSEGLANHYTSNHPIPLQDPPDSLVSNEQISLNSTNDKITIKRVQRPKGGMCSKCGKYYTNLHNHQQTHLPLSERWRHFCHTCGAGFVQKNQLRKHERRKHTFPLERPFSCQHCDKAFRSPWALRVHMRGHTGERPYKCKYCVKAFTQAVTLQTHMYVHTGRPHVCQECGRRFATKYVLQKHRERCNTKATGKQPQRDVVRGVQGSGSTSFAAGDHFPRTQTFQKIEIIDTSLPEPTD